MYNILKHAHSGLRYLILVLLVVAVVQAVVGWLSNRPYTEGNRKFNVFTLIFSHIQLLLGLALYFLGGWFSGDSSVALARYWKMEHIGMMIFAIILITVGNARSKRGDLSQSKHRAIAIYFGLALIVIVAAIIGMTTADPTRSFFGVS